MGDTLILSAENLSIGKKVGIRHFDFDAYLEHYIIVELCQENEDHFWDYNYNFRINKKSGKIEEILMFDSEDNKFLDTKNLYNLNNEKVIEKNRLYNLKNNLIYLSREIYKIKVEGILDENKDLQERNLNDIEEAVSTLRVFL